MEISRDFIAGTIAGATLLFLAFFLFFPVHSATVVSSPGAEGEVISLINSAESSIYVETYVFTSEEMMDALISAKMRGVDVKVIMEKRIDGNPDALAYSRLLGSGVGVCWASQVFKLTHSKIIIVDGRKALVGSHNLSYSALNTNREISLLVEGGIVAELLSIFNSDWAACST